MIRRHASAQSNPGVARMPCCESGISDMIDHESVTKNCGTSAATEKISKMAGTKRGKREEPHDVTHETDSGNH